MVGVGLPWRTRCYVDGIAEWRRRCRELRATWRRYCPCPGSDPSARRWRWASAACIGCGQEHLPVDIHAHRIANRWGIVAEKTPEKTQRALMEVLPKERWLEINEQLVPFGKHVCTGALPRCSECPLRAMCQQVGVQRHR